MTRRTQGPLTIAGRTAALVPIAGRTAALAAGLICTSAEAQDAGPLALDTIEITATGITANGGLAAGTTEGSGSYTPPATNTAAKFALAPRDTPQTVAVITDQVIDDFQLTDVHDVLQAAPFVSIQTERSPGVWFATTRGTEELNVQFDGIPGPSSILNRGAIPLDTAFIDRTEILYGAQGLLAGAGGAGGIINIVRKMPTEDLHFGAEAGIDSRGSARFVGDASGPLTASGRVRGRLIGVVDDQDSFVDDAWFRRNSLYGVVEADVRNGTTLALGGLYVDYEASTANAYGLPARIDGSFLDLPRSTNLGADWGRDARRARVASLKLDQTLPGDWRLRGALSYAESRSRLTEAIPQGPFLPGSDNEYVVQAQREGWETTTWSLDAYAAGTARLFGRDHEIMVGLNGLHDREHTIGGYWVEGIANDRGESSVLQVSHAFDHDPGSVPRPGADDWFQAWGPWTSTTEQVGTYAAGRFSLAGPAHLILGARATWWAYRDDGPDSVRETAVTPYAALTYEVSSWGTVYASYSRIFDPNTITDANLRVLPPKEGHTYEVGVKGSFFENRLDASAAVYRLDQTNLPEDDLAAPMVCNGWYCSKPSGRVISDGVDLSVSGQITPDWSILAGYSYVSSELNDTGAPFSTLYPQHIVKVSTAYALPGDRWTIGAQARYQSEIYSRGELTSGEDTVAYEVAQPGYTVVDVMARYRISERAALQLNVENLFDKTYFDGISWPRHGNTYGAPRTATLTLRADF